MHWKTLSLPRMKKEKCQNQNLKVMLIVFFDIDGTVMTEWVPEFQTVNQTYHLKVLSTLCEKVCKKWPELWKNKSWILYQENASAYNVLSVKRYLAVRGTPAQKHVPNGFDLAPCDIFLFPQIKSALKGTQFESIKEVKWKLLELRNALIKEDFQHCFDRWKNEWNGVWQGEGGKLKGSIQL